MFEKEHSEYSLNKYGEILKEQNIEWGTRSMCAADVSSLSGQQVMALLMGAVRVERFCDGALKEFVENGSITKWLERLKEIDKCKPFEECMNTPV